MKKKIDYDTAEKHYGRAYEINNEYPDLLSSYGQFLRDVRMDNEKAQILFDYLEKIQKTTFSFFDTSYRLKAPKKNLLEGSNG